MRRPPDCVAFVAKTHWLVGAVIVVSLALLYSFTRRLPMVEFGTRTYAITGGLAALYLLAGTLVWFGAPFGPLLSRVCSLLYLARPNFGSLVWETMNSAEFKAHFGRAGTGENPRAGE
jgi:hypothetical protein